MKNPEETIHSISVNYRGDCPHGKLFVRNLGCIPSIQIK